MNHPVACKKDTHRGICTGKRELPRREHRGRGHKQVVRPPRVGGADNLCTRTQTLTVCGCVYVCVCAYVCVRARRQLTRGDVVMIVIAVIRSMNRAVRDYYSPKYGWVQRAHERCGIFPQTPTPVNDINVFKRHLESLNENEVYARLSDCAQQLNMEEAASDVDESDSEGDATDAEGVFTLQGLEDYYTEEQEETRALLDIFGEE
eukprot:GHVU01063893.1.p1 GENE.GHVU01063893.1~~GHVU01063893.1.p1  ORF type:complete len:205 (+),score=16.38 GHVU01063893.1:27-641(+)